MKSRKELEPAVIEFLNESLDPDVVQLKPYVHCIEKWTDKQFWNVHEFMFQKMVEKIKSNPVMLKEVRRMLASHLETKKIWANKSIWKLI